MIYQVKTKNAIDGKDEFQFSSLAAIYTVLTPEEVGIKLDTLWKKKVKVGSPYVGKKSTVTAFEVVGKKHRGK